MKCHPVSVGRLAFKSMSQQLPALALLSFGVRNLPLAVVSRTALCSIPLSTKIPESSESQHGCLTFNFQGTVGTCSHIERNDPFMLADVEAAWWACGSSEWLALSRLLGFSGHHSLHWHCSLSRQLPELTVLSKASAAVGSWAVPHSNKIRS